MDREVGVYMVYMVYMGGVGGREYNQIHSRKFLISKYIINVSYIIYPYFYCFLGKAFVPLYYKGIILNYII